jgi:hypothetical protein
MVLCVVCGWLLNVFAVVILGVDRGMTLFQTKGFVLSLFSK